MQRIFIICEGHSESNYIKELQRLLSQKYGIDDLRIIDYPFCGGKTYTALKKHIENKIKEIKSEGRILKDKIYIWLDEDVFINKYPKKLNDFKQYISNKKLPVKIKLLFNHMNFEDFFILHFNEEKIIKLQEKLKIKKHFQHPLTSEKYIEIYGNVVTGYEKGNLPETFNFNLENLQMCVKNIENSNYNFYSDFENILKLIIERCSK